MKITLSKKQWQEIGKKTGWINKTAIFGPGFSDFLGSGSWKEQFGKPITTNIIVDKSPLIMTTQHGDQSIVVMVEHNGKHIGVYDPTRNGFDVTYTKDLEKYMSLKEVIDVEAKKILETKIQSSTIKNIKIAQSNMLDGKKLSILQKIFDAIPGKEGKDHVTGRTTSKEIMDEAMFRMYIQTYYSSSKPDILSIERYYESEYRDQDYHKTVNVTINWENPQETINEVLKTVNTLKTEG